MASDATATDAVDDAADDAAEIEASLRDPQRFAVLFDRHHAAIHRYLARRLGSHLADDLASETFITAFERRGRYDAAQASALPWLYGIANNLARRHRRSEQRQLRAYARTGVDPVVASHAEEVVARLAAVAATRRLAAQLAGLRDRDREALLLLAWAGLDYQQIAQALGVPVGTVRSRLHRARAQLRAALAAPDPDPDPDPDVGCERERGSASG
jgi:RNA polymerase sigma factor (sigma-70 family)